MAFKFGEETEFFKFGFRDSNSLSRFPIPRSKIITPASEPPAIFQTTTNAVAKPPKAKMAPSNANKASIAHPKPLADQPPPSKYEDASFEAWIRAQDIIISHKGAFTNKSDLKEKLIAKCQGSAQADQKKAAIRRVINQIGREIHLGQLPTQSPSLRQSTLGFQPTSTAKRTTKQVEVKVKAKTVTTPSPRMDSDSETEYSNYTDSDESTEPVTPIKTATNGQPQSSSLHRPVPKIDTSSSASPEDEKDKTPANDPQNLSNPKISELNAFLQDLKIGGTKNPKMAGEAISTTFTLDQQLELLNFDSELTEEAESSIHNVKNAVLFSGTTLDYYGHQILPQYGLLGSSASSSTNISDGRLFLNTNIPFSAFICGIQGSGKSHSTACMIENCLIPSPLLGNLQKPLSALVFNFAEYSSHKNFRPSEVAFLASPNKQNPNHLKVKKVNVLVSPSNYHSLNALYSQILGVSVQPFLLRPQDMNIATMLTLMSVDHTQAAPLYLGTVTKVLREMAAQSSGSFNYTEFRRRLDEAGFDKKQLDFLNQRLDLLESFMDLEGATTSPTFNAGEITIIDLSCPFLDASTACVLFKIGMDMYLRSGAKIGKLIVLDEAHKYMTDTPASKALTESLLSIIRQQRHFGARVLIATQEPTVSSRLIDLCSMTIIHRFSSPEWLNVLKKHVSILEVDGKDQGKEGLFNKIVRLKTGEALVFAPSAILGTVDKAGERDWTAAADELLRVRVRKRVTWDGGRSVVCV